MTKEKQPQNKANEPKKLADMKMLSVSDMMQRMQRAPKLHVPKARPTRIPR